MRVATGIAIIIAASATMAHEQSAQEQATCAEQAKAAFEEYKGGAPPGTSDYQSHYSNALNKCFILIKQMSELNGQQDDRGQGQINGREEFVQCAQ